MERHYNNFQYMLDEILSKLSAKKINKYKVSLLIQKELKYCNERDKRIQKKKQQIEINAAIELNKI